MAEEADAGHLLPIGVEDELPMETPAIEDALSKETPAAPVWVEIPETKADLLADVPAGKQKVNLALNKSVEVSGTEVNDGRFTGEMAVDGEVSNASRWSPAKQNNQWIVVDLGEEYSIDQIIINFSAVSPEYKVLVSTTNSEEETDWTEVHSVSTEMNKSTGVAEVVNIEMDSPVSARYVKYQQLQMWPHSNGQKYSSSIYELEVYSSDVLEEADTNVNLALNRPVTFSSEQTGSGSSNNPAVNAVDGDGSTRWASSDDQFPQWITVDLGQTCDITSFVCNFYNGGTARAYQYKIETSELGVDYETLIDASENTTTGVVKHDAPENTRVRFVRVTFSGAKQTNGNDYAINSGFYEFEIYGSEPAPLPGAKDNLALNQTVTASSIEVAKFAAANAVDGDATGDSRWAPDKDINQREREEWLQVDLGTLRTVQQIDIKFESEAHAYEVFVSVDGTEGSWQSVATVNPTTEGGTVNKTFLLAEPMIVRYVKYVQTEQWKHATNGRYYGGSIYEIEVYQEPLFSAETVLEEIKDTAPTIEDGALVLPESPNENYIITLYGCDNQQIVTMDGEVRTPLVDMPVNVLYKVTNKENEKDTATSETDVKFIVPGQYQPEAGDNEKPNVVPGLREWKGATGDFELTTTSAIVLDSASATALGDTAKLYQQYFKEMLDREITVKTGTPAAGDIFLKLDSSLEYLGGEGYVLEADDIVTISSSSTTGALYGGISLTQVLYQDETHTHFPKGTTRDYPKYEVRAGMLDVGRMYIPLDYVKEMALYMGWFKLNNLHMHINDYWGNAGYSAFRLESTTYPSIVAKDGYYTKAEYKQFQKDLAQYGIQVITEIDSPYHAESFREIPGVSMKAAGQLDIRTDETYASSIQIIKNLMDEYLDGRDPVFQGNAYHIGTDEYDKGASEQMRKYTDELIKYTNSKGRETRVWASLGKNGFNGKTPVTNEATVNLWATYWADAKETYDAGFNVINTEGGWLYIVPRSNAGYPDRIDLASRYNQFEVNNFSSPRTNSMQGGRGVAIMPVAHPQTKGAQFAIWNDMTSFRGGYSEFDVYDRFKNMVALVSEKTWYGEKDEDQTGEQFVERFDAVGSRAPGANPGRVVESAGELVADVDFTSKAKDYSGNDYDGVLTGGATVTTDEGKAVLKLDGTGSLALPFGSIGYPYTAKIEVKLDADTPADTLIFAGGDGELYANMDGTGHPGYKRSYHDGTQYVGYTFVWNDVTLPVDQWFTLVLTCDASNTTLYIDGEAQTRATMTDASRNNGFQEIPKISGSAPNDSSTFVLPVERIGENLKGELAGLQVYNRVLTAAEIEDFSKEVDPDVAINVALGKPATASSVYPGSVWTADKAVDGIVDDTTTKNSRWSTKRIGSGTPAEQYDSNAEQWLKIDLENSYSLEKVTVFWEGACATSYKVQGSLDGEEYFDLVADGSANAAGLQIFEFEDGTEELRYLRVLCQTPKTARYGYSIFEVEAYAKPIVHTVTFEANGGSEMDSVIVVDGHTVKRPTQPTKDGYIFNGWYADEELTQAYDFNTAVTADVTLYAQWLEKVTVTFETNGGSAVEAVELTKGSTVEKPADPTRSGYTFDGWFGDEELTEAYYFESLVEENITLYAKWTKKSTTPTNPNRPSTGTTPMDTTTEIRDDGSTVTTVTKPDGTVTETTEMPDGTTVVVETKKDGTVTETVEEPDGTKSVTETKPDGSKTATVEQPDGTTSETVTTAEGNTTITVTDPDGEELAKVEIPAEIPAPETTFDDIDQTPWATTAINNVAGLKLVEGIGGNKYDPTTPMTRGALATVFHRLSNGKTDYKAAFKDVQDNKYYSEGVAWVAKAGVMKGMTAEIFAPDQIITREQLAVMMARYAKLIGMDTKTDAAALDEFTDGDSTGAWAVDGVAWCVENGILRGKGNDILDPTADVTRAEVAVMLDRFIALIK